MSGFDSKDLTRITVRISGRICAQVQYILWAGLPAKETP
jgi:hypothetical protein